MADKKSDLTQIAQSVLDEANQAVKVSVVSDSGGSSDVNLESVAGQPVDTGNGVVGPGTQRVVLAADQATVPVDIQDTELAVAIDHTEDSITVYTPNNNTTPIPVFEQSAIDTGNSTSAPLGPNGVFAGTPFDAKDYSTLCISVKSDQSAAANGISVQYSSDGTNWDHIHAYDYLANTGLSYNLPLEMRYVRVVYTNGPVGQSFFRMNCVFRRDEVSPSMYTIGQGVNDYTLATPTKSVIYGKTTVGGGEYVAVKVNPSGALTTEVTGEVKPVMAASGHLLATTSATGTSYVVFASQACRQLTISNQSGTTLEFQQGGAGAGFLIPTGSFYTFFGITNTNQLGVRRADTNATQVNVTARWES